MRKKISPDRISRMRIQEAFDFCRLHNDEMTFSQQEFVRGLRKQHKERGLSEKQLQCLYDLVKYLKPDEVLRIKTKY